MNVKPALNPKDEAKPDAPAKLPPSQRSVMDLLRERSRRDGSKVSKVVPMFARPMR